MFTSQNTWLKINMCLSVYSQFWSVDLLGLNQYCASPCQQEWLTALSACWRALSPPIWVKPEKGRFSRKKGGGFFHIYLKHRNKGIDIQLSLTSEITDASTFYNMCYWASHTFIRNMLQWFVILVWRSWVSYLLQCLWLRRSDWRSWIRPIREPNCETASCMKRNQQHNISNTIAFNMNVHIYMAAAALLSNRSSVKITDQYID